MTSSQGLHALLERVIARPVAVTMIVVASAVFGAVSFSKLRVDLLPEIGYPTITVRTRWPGAAPEDVEDRVSERVQEALSTLSRLVRASSISRAETSDVLLEFEWGTPMAFAVQEVRDRLDSVFLPDGAEKPLILRYDPNLDPILRIAVSLSDPARARVAGSESDPARRAERELVHLRWLCENRIQRELETLTGVAAVQVRGGLTEEIRVRVDPFRMAAQGLDPRQVGVRLAQENLNASGGLIREGSTEYLVRTLNEFQDVREIGELSIVQRNGASIRVRDVAVVDRSHAEREVITRVGRVVPGPDGSIARPPAGEAVELAIYREAGANVVQVADGVLRRVFGNESEQAAAERLERESPGGQRSFGEDEPAHLAWALRKDLSFERLSDQSLFIRDSIEDVQMSALLGILLTVLAIQLSLRALVPTLLISLSIPISVIVTFVPLYLTGTTLNVMSLGGLALGVGMVVDASIVVLEAIQVHRDRGEGAIEAAVNGASEVVGAITASTLTSVAVFAPIVFVHGVAGRIFGDQALTVVSSMSVSLVVAALFIPMLAARAGALVAHGAAAEAKVERAKRPPLSASFAGARGRMLAALPVGLGRIAAWIAGCFLRVVGAVLAALRWLLGMVLRPFEALHARGWAHVERGYPKLLRAALARPWIPLALAAALAFVAGLRVRHLGFDLLPDVHQGEFTYLVGLQVGTRLEATDEAMSEVERGVRALAGVERTALVVGVERDTLTREIEGKHTARLSVRLDRKLANLEDETRVAEQVRALIEAHPAVRTVSPPSRPTPFAVEAPVEVEVLGFDLERLNATATEVARRLQQVHGLEDVRTSARAGHPEARLTFDRDAMLEYGLDLAAVSALVREQVLGEVSTRFREGEDRIDVRVLGDEIVRGDLDRVMDLVVNPGQSAPVRLADVARVDTVTGPAEIRRIGNARAVLVSAAVPGLDLLGATGRVERALEGLKLPDDVAIELGGRKREMDEARGSLIFALALALFLVYAVMAAQFESLLQPLIILLTVPLAGIGVVFALEPLGMPVSVIVFIGLILLSGIVVSNAIVMLERVNQTRAQGLDVKSALLEACATRLRPIYLTTNTTLLGLLPMTGWMDGLPGMAALTSGAGAELRAPLAVTVIAGLTFSTLLTLIVVPCAYRILVRDKPTQSEASPRSEVS